ncbi:MAG: alginate lyase family protein [Bacteroidaceae bacterium]|nr:alginate lyase family protein [Bacteroidaceae bacterium]
MQYGRLFRTVAHLRPVQVWRQVAMRLHKTPFRPEACPDGAGGRRGLVLPAAFIEKPVSMDGDTFTFLNLAQRFDDWNDTRLGMLWAYNLNYMDYLLQPGVSAFDGRMWIDRFLRDLPARTVGLDPYPTALRLINWAKFHSLHYSGKDAPPAWRDAFYAQYRHLRRRLERHLLGNHLLEDAFGLYVAALHLGQPDRERLEAARLLLGQLKEQTLADGAHYEQSPMYHCILLDRLLDCLNFALAASAPEAEELCGYAVRMLGHLDSIAWSDGTLPLFGDAAVGIAPTPDEIRAYAQRLGLSWQAVPMADSGYRKLADGALELVADVGNVAARYQPGHTHSDPLTFELRVGGQPLVVDTGISTYEKNARRQYERSYAAHNTAQAGAADEPFEVWGGFRVGRTARVRILADRPAHVEAQRRGKVKATRAFDLADGTLKITDTLSAPTATARFHLAPGVEATVADDGSVRTPLATFRFEGEDVEVGLTPCEVSTEYNNLRPALCVEVRFSRRLTTTVSSNSNGKESTLRKDSCADNGIR